MTLSQSAHLGLSNFVWLLFTSDKFIQRSKDLSRKVKDRVRCFLRLQTVVLAPTAGAVKSVLQHTLTGWKESVGRVVRRDYPHTITLS